MELLRWDRNADTDAIGGADGVEEIGVGVTFDAEVLRPPPPR